MDREQIKAGASKMIDGINELVAGILADSPIPPPPPPDPDPQIIFFKLADGSPIDPQPGEWVEMRYEVKNALSTSLSGLDPIPIHSVIEVTEPDGTTITGSARWQPKIPGVFTPTLTANGKPNTKPATASFAVTVAIALPPSELVGLVAAT